MPETTIVVDNETTERARKNETVIREGLCKVGQERAAACMGVNRTTVSRMQTDEFRKIAMLLAACGLKVVPQEMRCAKPEVLDALLVINRAAMNQNDSHSLVWE